MNARATTGAAAIEPPAVAGITEAGHPAALTDALPVIHPAAGVAATFHARGRLLVVDDEYGVRSGLEQLLAMEGYEVVAVASGREALACLAQREFDVALIDYQLPDIDGLTLGLDVSG